MKIDKNCLEFFNEEGAKEIKFDKILSVYSFFEHLCFNDLCKILQKEYKNAIEDEIKDKIKEKFLDNKSFDEDISILELGAVVRRFISRYLVGKKNRNDIEPKSMLLSQLKRIDLWGYNIKNLDNLGNSISKLIEEFEINVGQSLSFYEIIKEEDEKEINMDDRPEEEEEEEISINRKIKKRFKN